MRDTTGKAAVFVGSGQPLEIREYPVRRPRAGTVLLRLGFSGICGTDVHVCEGRLPIPGPFIPGHEFIGKVERCGLRADADGPGKKLRPGDTVIACAALPCGKCFNCRQGETASCLDFGVSFAKDPAAAPHFFGGFAEFLHQPAHTLVKLPAGVSVAAAAAFPCAGPTSIRAFDFAGNLRGDELVVVQGTGPVGLFAIAWAARAGCRVIAIGSGASPARLALARRFGASDVLDYRRTPAAERLGIVQKAAAKMKRGDGADVVFEASGSPAAVPEGMHLVRTLGTYIVPGQYSQSGGIEIQPQLITFKAMRIIGSGQYKLADIVTYLRFLKRHPDIQRRFASCIQDRYAVADANHAMADVSAGKTVKAVFTSPENV